MKKLIPLFLALAMVFSLCACGGGSDAPKTEEPQTDNSTPATVEPQTETTTPPEESTSEYSEIGDTVVSDSFEFALTNAKFANSIEFVLSINGSRNDNFLTETLNGSTYSAADGKVLLYYSYTFKYIGKESQTFSPGAGSSVSYGDGYTFKTYKNYLGKEDTWEVSLMSEESSQTAYTFSFQPLDSNIYECRGYFELPKEVADNTSEPVLMILNVGSGDTATYRIR